MLPRSRAPAPAAAVAGRKQAPARHEGLTQKGDPGKKHSSKLLLQKSAGLARIPQQRRASASKGEHHRASVSILNPPPTSAGRFDPVPGGYRVGRQSTLHAPATETLSQTSGTSHRNRALATVWCEAVRDGLFGVARAWLCCCLSAVPAG